MIYIYNEKGIDVSSVLKQYPESEVVNDKEKLFSLIPELNEGDKVIFPDILNMNIKRVQEDSKDINTAITTVSVLYQTIFATGADVVIQDMPELNSEIFRNAIINNHMRDSSAVEMAVSEILEAQIRIIIEEKLKKKKRKRSTKIGSNSKRLGNPKGSKYVVKKEIHCKKFMLDNHIDFGGTMTNAEVLEALRISKATFFKYKKELRASNSITPALSAPDQVPDSGKINKVISDKEVMDAQEDKESGKSRDEEEKAEKKSSSARKNKKGNNDQGIEGQTSIFDFT